MRRLLIVNSSEIFALSLARKLGGGFDIRICCDGIQAGAMLESFCPDVLILHTAMPRKDSLSILQEMSCRPGLIIAITNFLDSRMERRLMAFGAAQILLMPTVASVYLCVQSLLAEQAQGDIRHSIPHLTRLHLHILNFQTHLEGFGQLCVAIPLRLEEPNWPLTKQLYPAVAQMLGVSDGRAVEHSIRKSICAAWQQRDDFVWARYFPPDADGQIPCPSNNRFLSALEQIIRQEMSD